MHGQYEFSLFLMIERLKAMPQVCWLTPEYRMLLNGIDKNDDIAHQA